MTAEYPLLIPGIKERKAELEVRAPFDDELIARFTVATHDDVEQALTTAQALFRDRDNWLPVHQRLEILQKTAELMSAEAEDLARQAALEGGKPLQDSRVEVVRAIDGIQGCIECLRTQSGREIPMELNLASQNRLAFTQHEPIGPVVAVSAFNHPLNLIVHQVGPAIAAGNPVIVKPAEDTPISCYRLVSMLHEVGLPKAWCQALVVNEIEVASALVTDPRVAFFSFIGSARVGWMLRSKLAAGTRCALEHGGAAPVIVAADADLERGLPLLAKGGFYHAGQVCVSVQRVFAERSIARELAEELARLAQTLVVGDPSQAETDVGPLIRQREVSRVHEWVEEARSAATEVLCGGLPLSESCYAPTVLYDPPEESKVSQQEIFGPVICVYPYDEIDEAITRANAVPTAFQAAVLTQNIDQALYASRRLAASAVMLNDHTAFRVDWMPFAGLRESGLGVGGIPYTFHDMQIEKMLVIHSPNLT